MGHPPGDGAAFGAPFAEDAAFVDIRGEHHRGRQAITQGHQTIFATVYRGSAVRYELIDARPLALSPNACSNANSGLRRAAGVDARVSRRTSVCALPRGLATAAAAGGIANSSPNSTTTRAQAAARRLHSPGRG